MIVLNLILELLERRIVAYEQLLQVGQAAFISLALHLMLAATFSAEDKRIRSFQAR